MLIGDVVGVFGGYIVGVFRLGFNPAIYLSRTLEYLEISDVTLGLVKAAVFGFLIALMGCYHGYHSGRGAEGVGRATTNAVVSASILILISNYLVTALFLGCDMTAKPKIQMTGVTKTFGDNAVLKGIDLTVVSGESLVIIGTSGCGKSVTLKCLNGLITPDYGSIKIDGVEILGGGRAAIEDLRRKFGMTFQFGALFDSLPIWENVTFRLRQRQKLTKAEARDIAVTTIIDLGLAPKVIDQYPAELSGGMQKRVALARAIVDKPEILLFDEPTSGLDPITGGVIDRLIIDAVRRLGATTVTISHDMASVRRIADRVAMVHNGVILWCGDVKDMNKSGVPEVHQFVHGLVDGPLTQMAAPTQQGQN